MSGFDPPVRSDVGVRESLLRLPRGLAGLDVGQFDEAALRGLLGEVRAVQRCLDGLVVRIGVRTNELAALGVAGSADEALRGDGEVGARQARRESARTRAAERIPGLREAVSAGATTGEHVDSIARHTGKLSEEQRTAFDFADLVERATRMLPESFDRHVKRCVDAAKADHGLSDTKAKQAASEFRYWFDENAGMGRFSGSLDPERYEMLVGAVERRVSSKAAASDGTVEKNANLAAEALVDLVASAGGDGRRVASMLVVVDHETMVSGPHDRSLRQTENGHDVSAESIARLACDAVIRQVGLDEVGVPIKVGRKYRTATDAQWASIKAVHSSCAFDGCQAPISWCQAHHIHEWEHGGLTDLDNLVPLCSRHHHQVHEGGWSLKLVADRSLKIYKPNGAHVTTVPPPSRTAERP